MKSEKTQKIQILWLDCNVRYQTFRICSRISTSLQAHLPVGIKLTVKKHEKADENYRYIPDLLLMEKQAELKSLDDPLVRKALGWE